jgi:hypothetical protein
VVTHAQKEDKISFFINMMTILYLSGLVGHHAGAFSGFKVLSLEQSPGTTSEKAQTGLNQSAQEV